MLTKNKLSLLKDAACVVLSFSVLANCYSGSLSVYKAEAKEMKNSIAICRLHHELVQPVEVELDNSLLQANDDVSFDENKTVLSYVTKANLSYDELNEVVMKKSSADVYQAILDEDREMQAQKAADESNKAVYEASLIKNPNMVIPITYDELDLLERLVECEAGNQDMIGRILVANTIINRYNSPKFPNDISRIILWPGQYSPVSSGHINTIQVSDMSKEAVQRALSGEDYSKNAFYFMNRRYSCASSIRWFDTLPKVVEHQDHEFFTEY